MPLTLRLTLTYLLVTLGGLLLLGGGSVWLFGVYTAQQRAQELENQATIYGAYLDEVIGDGEALEALAADLAARAALPRGVIVRIFARNGTLLAGDRQGGPFPSRPALAFVRGTLPLPASQVSGRRYTARPIGGASDPIGVVELSQSTAVEDALRTDLVQALVPVAFGSALLMALVSFVVARSISQPIGRLQRLAESLAAGELGRRSGVLLQRRSRRDEIGRLAASLDHMAAQLEGRIAEAEGERGKLAAVLESISEGVVSLDRQGAIVFANPAAMQLLGLDTNKAKDELLARIGALDLPLLPTKAIDQERAVGPRTLLVTAAPIIQRSHPEHAPALASAPHTIIVLRDITRLNALEQARVRFVRSISHELRTPLTAIRGLLENVRDDARPDQQPSLATLEEETARLGRLVEELLRPSANGDLLPAERRPVDLGQLARELVALQQGRARRAGITLQAAIDDRVPLVRGDRDRLKQVLLNLIDNALKATPANGQVLVQVAPDGKGVGVAVEDSGPGVPEVLRERIWERGVTGGSLGLEATGGAGLGLALVREIVAGYGGRALVEDSPLGGARFVVVLP